MRREDWEAFAPQAPSAPPVLTSFINMSPEHRAGARDERPTKMKKLLRKASVIGWWKKKGEKAGAVAGRKGAEGDAWY